MINNKNFLIELRESIVSLKDKYKIKEDDNMDMCMLDGLISYAKDHMDEVPCDLCNRIAIGMYPTDNDLSRYLCCKCAADERIENSTFPWSG